MKEHEKILCPSSKCKTGSEILGVRQDDGTVAILPQTLPVDAGFIERVGEDDISAEQKFRFTNKCIEGGCSQWTGKSCGVIERVLEYMEQLPVKDNLPACAIRKNCRWFRQSGAEACKVCVFVITEVTEHDTRVLEAVV
jgi:hypothetical protein